jgi:hypothetical protein
MEENVTYTPSFNGDTLLILMLEGITEESNGEIEG